MAHVRTGGTRRIGPLLLLCSLTASLPNVSARPKTGPQDDTATESDTDTDEVDGDGYTVEDGDCDDEDDGLYPHDSDGDGIDDGCGWRVSAGQEHSCALDTSGTIECWGKDEYGQVSDVP